MNRFKQLRNLLIIGAFASGTFSVSILADDMSGELRSKLDATVQDIQLLSNEISDILEKTDENIGSKTIALSSNDRNSGLFGIRRRKTAIKKGSIVRSIEKQDKKQDKKNISIKNGDYELNIGGKTKIEHYFKKNIALLNSDLPDQVEYFKNTFDLIFDFNFGEKTFGHKAIQAYTALRHKGVWGRGAVFADSDAGSPVEIKLSDTTFGKHNHTNGKPLIWIKDAWLKFSINAALGQKHAKCLHFIQLGWFPFDLGRGIALGAAYGLNRELLGLYSYPEDKSAPGINISGEIVKDKLRYDLYYSKFEEHDKNLRDTLNLIKAHHVGRKANPWRGVAKDDEVFAARLKWKALKDHKFGSLELQPYIFYNEASDQKVELIADTKTELGAVGLSLEHSYKKFEWGGEVAFNFGDEILKKIDRNRTKITRDKNGNLVEQFTHILDTNNNNKALVTENSKKAAQIAITKAKDVLTGNFKSEDNRIRESFKNKLRGWMTVVDAAYNFDSIDLSVAAAYGYASGDDNPHKEEKNKTYKGFIGLHEYYTGKRVKSIIILDERSLQTPSSLLKGDSKAGKDFAFSDLQHVGLNAMWKPRRFKSRKLILNPNLLFFWKATSSKKFDIVSEKATDEDASKFMGTEINLVASFELIQDLKLFGNFAVFIPGGYFKDVKGVPMDNDYFKILSKTGVTGLDEKKFRISDDTSYYMNVGLEYKF